VGGDPLHRFYMAQALEEAKAAAAEGEVPVGAVVVQGGRVVAHAHNRREALADPTAHAEMLAIREASRVLGRWRLHDCTLYVTLEPCAMCAAATVEARIPTLVYGASDARRGAVGSFLNLPGLLEASVERIGGVLEEEAAELLRTFFRERRTSPDEESFRRDV
jgi:tRNA(adenine34) deaminase